MDISVSLYLPLFCGGAVLLFFTFGKNCIPSGVFAAHPPRKVKGDDNRKEEVSDGDEVWFAETMCIQTRSVNKNTAQWDIQIS